MLGVSSGMVSRYAARLPFAECWNAVLITPLPRAAWTLARTAANAGRHCCRAAAYTAGVRADARPGTESNRRRVPGDARAPSPGGKGANQAAAAGALS